MCRVISRAPGLKLVVETLISSLRPIGNIVLICCAFFVIFGILGVQVRTLGVRRGPGLLPRGPRGAGVRAGAWLGAPGDPTPWSALQGQVPLL